MKRQLTLLACLSLVVVMLFGLASCKFFNKPDETHTHNYVEGKCECGEADPNYVAPHTHNFVEGKCECGESDPDYKAPECEHAYSAATTKEPTCTEDGVKTFTCTECGDSYEQTLAALGHNKTKLPGYAATCTESGLTDGLWCPDCETVFTAQTAIDPIPHTFVDGVCGCGEVDPEYNGPKTYTLSTADMFILNDDGTQNLTDKAYFAADSAWGTDGYFTVVGEVYQRVKNGEYVYCVEIQKQDKGGVQFTVTGTADVTINFHSTGGSNTSWLGLRDADGNLVANNEGVNTVTGTGSGLDVTYTGLTAGTYTICSPALTEVDAETGEEKDPYNRAVRLYSVSVTETPATEEPQPEANKLTVETTDTYCWVDLYSFTAEEMGYYSFTLPAGLGLWSAEKFEKAAPECDYYDNGNGYTVTVGLTAGQTFEYYVASTSKDVWTITWTFEAGEVESGTTDTPVTDSDALVIGENTIVIGDEHVNDGKNYTFVVTEANTYTFSSNDLLAIIYDANGMQLGRYELYLEPGTYTIQLVSFSGAGVYSVNVKVPGSDIEPEDPTDPSASDLVVGENTVVIDEDHASTGIELSFTVTVEDTYTFASNDLMANIFDETGMMVGRGVAYLAPGTYTVALYAPVGAGTYTVTISGTTSEPGEEESPVGSWDNPNVVETPYTGSATVESWGTYYYAFTATANGHVTVVVTGGNLESLTINDKYVSELTFAVIAGNTYEIVLYNDEASTHNVAISFVEGELTADDYKSIYTNMGANDADYFWSVALQNDNGYYVNVMDGDWASDYCYSYDLTINEDGSLLLHNLKVLEDLYHAGTEYVVANKFNILLVPGEYGYTLSFVSAEAEAPACQHTETETTTVDASCLVDGSVTVVCKACGETVSTETITAPGHDYDTIVTKPTCTAGGYTEHICGICDYSYTDSETEATGHNFVNGTCACGEKDPNYTYTVADALQAAEGTVVTLTGTVVSMYENWSSYNNCSPYIQDESGSKILVFRTTTKVHVGDVITVTGKVTAYNNVNQIAQSGSTVTIVTPHTCSYTDATCTDDSVCTSCGALNGAALGHTAANAEGKCDRCGIDLSISYVEKELSFSNKTNRTTFTTSQQVWAANGVTLTNDKGSSTSNVADYANPARFYKSSKITIDCAGMTKIEFVCNSGDYATALKSSIASNSNYTVSVSGSTVTVTFVEAVDTFVIASLSGGQVRMNSLTVTAKG